ncbi:MAG: aminotransferase class V-fold PLP-dependent enzyme, partial [Candidatus Dadabacteria bacterium]|nr:aminotransferase class V-fold PLP-dependent enzyme [Candidatus Dadabacteria bacterium]
DEDGIAVRSGHHCAQPLMARLRIEHALRASFYVYNTTEEIDKFIKSLGRAYKIFKK